MYAWLRDSISDGAGQIGRGNGSSQFTQRYHVCDTSQDEETDRTDRKNVGKGCDDTAEYGSLKNPKESVTKHRERGMILWEGVYTANFAICFVSP